MYSISARLSRKLIGTSTRPQPLTPKNEVSSRAEFCETTATRPPTGTPSWSSRAACARALAAISPVGQLAQARRRLVRLVDDPDPVGVDVLGAVQEVPDGQRVVHTHLQGLSPLFDRSQALRTRSRPSEMPPTG